MKKLLSLSLSLSIALSGLVPSIAVAAPAPAPMDGCKNCDPNTPVTTPPTTPTDPTVPTPPTPPKPPTPPQAHKNPPKCFDDGQRKEKQRKKCKPAPSYEPARYPTLPVNTNPRKANLKPSRSLIIVKDPRIVKEVLTMPNLVAALREGTRYGVGTIASPLVALRVPMWLLKDPKVLGEHPELIKEIAVAFGTPVSGLLGGAAAGAATGFTMVLPLALLTAAGSTVSGAVAGGLGGAALGGAGGAVAGGTGGAIAGGIGGAALSVIPGGLLGGGVGALIGAASVGFCGPCVAGTLPAGLGIGIPVGAVLVGGLGLLGGGAVGGIGGGALGGLGGAALGATVGAVAGGLAGGAAGLGLAATELAAGTGAGTVGGAAAGTVAAPVIRAIVEDGITTVLYLEDVARTKENYQPIDAKSYLPGYHPAREVLTNTRKDIKNFPHILDGTYKKSSCEDQEK